MEAWVYLSEDNKPVTEMMKSANKPGSGVLAFLGPVQGEERVRSPLAESLRAIATQVERGSMTGRKLVVILEG